MKRLRKTLCIVLSILMVLPFALLCASAAEATDYVLVPPMKTSIGKPGGFTRATCTHIRLTATAPSPTPKPLLNTTTRVMISLLWQTTV